MAENKKNWIKGAIKKPGALTATAKGQGKSLDEICSGSNLSSVTARRCALRKTLKTFHKSDGKGGPGWDRVKNIMGSVASKVKGAIKSNIKRVMDYETHKYDAKTPEEYRERVRINAANKKTQAEWDRTHNK